MSDSFVTLWTVAHQAPLSMGFLRQEWVKESESPSVMEWVVFPFSRDSSQPGDWTQVSCIAGGFFTSWVIGEAQEHWSGFHFLLQCMKVKSESEVAQSCPTLSNPMDCSPPGSFIHGIFQARVLEWGAVQSNDKSICWWLSSTCDLPGHFTSLSCVERGDSRAKIKRMGKETEICS